MIFRSPFPELPIPDLPLTDYVFEHVGQFADKPALVEGLTGRVYTYAELYGLVRRAASGLSRRGFTKGDVLAVFSPNVPEFAVAFHAAATLGGVVTPINPAYTAEELEHQLVDAGARLLVTVPGLLDKAGAAAAAAAGVEEVFVVGEGEGATPFASLLEADPRDVPPVEIDPREDLVALPYSSGTTGLSKGVMLTHRNCVANVVQVQASGHADASDTLVCVLPLFHIYGLQVILNHSLRVGATVVLLPRFDLEQLLGVIERHRVTIGHLVPPIVLALAKSPAVDGFDLSSMKTVFSGAAPLGRDVSLAVSERLGCLVKQGYGMTETAPATHLTPDGAERNRPGSVGCCVPHMECKLVSVETGEVVGAGERGEVCVRGPQVMRGYHRRPEATAATIDPDGWLHTGDIGYVDEDGYLFIVDRAKELIKYKGFQVAPAELEALLLTHPSVADAAVIPSPDEEAGEVPKAFVVVRDGHAMTEQEVINYVAGHVAPHKKVRLVEFAAHIPKSPSGKILRRLLVQRERERAGA